MKKKEGFYLRQRRERREKAEIDKNVPELPSTRISLKPSIIDRIKGAIALIKEAWPTLGIRMKALRMTQKLRKGETPFEGEFNGGRIPYRDTTIYFNEQDQAVAMKIDHGEVEGEKVHVLV